MIVRCSSTPDARRYHCGLVVGKQTQARPDSCVGVSMLGRSAAVFFSLCAVLSSCGPRSAPETPASDGGQPYREAIQLICEVDQRAELSAVEDPIELGQRRTDFLNERVKNPDAIEFRTLISVQSERDQARALRSEAKRVGFQRCALADSIESVATD